MTLQQLRYALAVASCHSFNEASRKMFVTQPTLSTALKELESELGILIFQRTNHGIDITTEGIEFLGYARKVVEQTEQIQERFSPKHSRTVRFTVCSQHYSFVVSAFIKLINTYGVESYDFCLREARTLDIIRDVHNLSADIGILYLSDNNQKVLERHFREEDLVFTPLSKITPHIFVSRTSSVAKRKSISFDELEDMPLICFEQGNYSADYYDEELTKDPKGKKIIRVSDRATLFNLLHGLNGYTVSSGIISKVLNPDVVSVPLEVNDVMTVGYLKRKNISETEIFKSYVKEMQEKLKGYKNK